MGQFPRYRYLTKGDISPPGGDEQSRTPTNTTLIATVIFLRVTICLIEKPFVAINMIGHR